MAERKASPIPASAAGKQPPPAPAVTIEQAMAKIAELEAKIAAPAAQSGMTPQQLIAALTANNQQLMQGFYAAVQQMAPQPQADHDLPNVQLPGFDGRIAEDDFYRPQWDGIQRGFAETHRTFGQQFEALRAQNEQLKAQVDQVGLAFHKRELDNQVTAAVQGLPEFMRPRAREFLLDQIEKGRRIDTTQYVKEINDGLAAHAESQRNAWAKELNETKRPSTLRVVAGGLQDGDKGDDDNWGEARDNVEAELAFLATLPDSVDNAG